MDFEDLNAITILGKKKKKGQLISVVLDTQKSNKQEIIPHIEVKVSFKPRTKLDKKKTYKSLTNKDL